MSPVEGGSPCPSCRKQRGEEAAAATLSFSSMEGTQAELPGISPDHPDPVGKGMVPSGSTFQGRETCRQGRASVSQRDGFGRGKHAGLGLRVSSRPGLGGGQAGRRFPNRRKVWERLRAPALAPCSSGKVRLPLRKLPQSPLISRENNGKKKYCI